jgi:hypothetical protein
LNGDGIGERMVGLECG